MVRDTLDGQPTKTVVNQKQHVTYLVEDGKPLPPELANIFGDEKPSEARRSIPAGPVRQEEAEGPVRTEDGYEEVTLPPPPPRVRS